MKLLMTALLFCASSSYAVQYIDCIPSDGLSADHVIVSLKSAQEGTLYLSSGLDENGESENSGVLALAQSKVDADQANYSASNTKADFSFSIPADLVMRATPAHEYFTATLNLKMKSEKYGVDDELLCFARIYE